MTCSYIRITYNTQDRLLYVYYIDIIGFIKTKLKLEACYNIYNVVFLSLSLTLFILLVCISIKFFFCLLCFLLEFIYFFEKLRHYRKFRVNCTVRDQVFIFGICFTDGQDTPVFMGFSLWFYVILIYFKDYRIR